MEAVKRRVRDDKMLCYCKSVTYGEVRASIRAVNARSVLEVTRECDAGGGCRTCHPEIEDLLEEARMERPGMLRRLWARLTRHTVGGDA
ncbi:MAG TPA: (2Fe-2S)-binding protein [Planctomycetes bacterium]|nr:(2Fe-2S)-binding protein [Planctomycetota bacterium]